MDLKLTRTPLERESAEAKKDSTLELLYLDLNREVMQVSCDRNYHSYTREIQILDAINCYIRDNYPALHESRKSLYAD